MKESREKVSEIWIWCVESANLWFYKFLFLFFTRFFAGILPLTNRTYFRTLVIMNLTQLIWKLTIGNEHTLWTFTYCQLYDSKMLKTFLWNVWEKLSQSQLKKISIFIFCQKFFSIPLKNRKLLKKHLFAVHCC